MLPRERVVGDKDREEEREYNTLAEKESRWTREIKFDCKVALKSHIRW